MNPQEQAQDLADARAAATPIDSTTQLVSDILAEESVVESTPQTEQESTLADRAKTLLIGRPRDLSDPALFKHVSLVAFLAWVGLGADGLSSSCYGPAEAFHNLMPGGADHTYLAVFLALATIGTVWIISSCYSHIIEEFPAGGGGYLVASKLLGRHAGVISGSALLVDYVLTITVSISAAGDALFGLLGSESEGWKLTAEIAAVLFLMLLNLRGVKETVLVMLPIFILFLVTHAILIFGAVLLNLSSLEHVAQGVRDGWRADVAHPDIGVFGALGLLLYAYSFGAGTYTGIEAVSNSMPVMREPRVATGKRTMVYMALSLALTAGGLILAYLLLDIRPLEGKTMNQGLTEVFLDRLAVPHPFSGAFLWATMLSEGALLLVAAQAGFIDGPRILASMARDNWAPHWFANLSERLTTHNGILLMGAAALAALVYTEGNVAALVVMYSINVFLTFSLSMLGMVRHWWQHRGRQLLWRRRLAQFGVGAALCVTILFITVYEKFFSGGWLTLGVTGMCVGLCVSIRGYYDRVHVRVRQLDDTLGQISLLDQPSNLKAPDPSQPTAAILVGGYGGLGIHTLLNTHRFAPGYFKNVLFLSVGVIDSGNFKGAEEVERLESHTRQALGQYVDLARRLGLRSQSYMAIGTDPVDELEHLCQTIAKDYPRLVVFAGQLVFQRDAWYQHLLHNQTAFALQRRLQWDGISMVILPTRIRSVGSPAPADR